MTTKTWPRNTSGLVAHAHRRAEETRRRVDQSIAALIHENKPINFATVATAAGVTTAYLYTQPFVRDRIEALRLQQAGQRRGRAAREERSDASKDLLLLAKDRRIKDLETENRRLRAEVKAALGKLYDQI